MCKSLRDALPSGGLLGMALGNGKKDRPKVPGAVPAPTRLGPADYTKSSLRIPLN